MFEQLIFGFNGNNGDVLFVYNDRFVIRQKGSNIFGGINEGNDKTIFYFDLSDIRIQEADFGNIGFLQFSLTGKNQITQDVLNSKRDENTIFFTAAKNEKAKAIYDFILTKIHNPA